VVKKLDIPFIKTRSFECGQACAAMIVKYFKPGVIIDFDKFNKIIHHVQGMYSFPLQLAILLDHYGLKTKCFSSGVFNTTMEDPGMFVRWFGKDLEYEMKFINVKTFDWMIKTGRRKRLYQNKKTKFDGIIKLFMRGNLVCFPIDANRLLGKKGPYEGHFVVISGVEEDSVFLHDPDVGPFVKYKKERVEKAYKHPAIADDLVVAYGKK
jgi:hypothetical protein